MGPPQISDPAVREAAELVAFDLLDPVLRSRKSVGKAAQELLKSSRFRKEMETLIRRGQAATCLSPRWNKWR